MMDWAAICLAAGLASGICWLIGDIFLVGFDVEEEKYGAFLSGTGIHNKRLAVLMLSGPSPRLRAGALIANFSIPLMLASVFALYTLAKPSFWSAVAAALLGVGFSISPVAHAAFYYVGTLCRHLYEDHREGRAASGSAQKLVNEYVRFTNITWYAAVGITFCGWLIYALLILLGQTAFPPFFALLTPLLLSPAAGLATAKWKIGRPYLNGAGLNIGLSIFFLAALVYYLFSL